MLEYAPTLAELDQIVWPMDLLPDEAVMLVVKYPVKAFRIESVELYTAGDPANPPVGDTTPPVIVSATITPDSLWPPDHKLVKMELNVQAVDIDDAGAPKPATWYTESVASNQPENGRGDGNTESDWLLDRDNDSHSLWLRAERSGKKKEARIYTVTVRAIHETGNLSDPVALEVRVEHDRGRRKSLIMSLAASRCRRARI